MSKKPTKKELQEQAEALQIEFTEDTTVKELTALIEEAEGGDNPNEDETAPKAVKFPTIKLGTRTIRFREGVDRLQIDGEVHDTSELIKDKEVVQNLLRGNSPFIEIVKK